VILLETILLERFRMKRVKQGNSKSKKRQSADMTVDEVYNINNITAMKKPRNH